MTGAHGYSESSSTWYYVTFQVESGDRMEFSRIFDEMLPGYSWMQQCKGEVYE